MNLKEWAEREGVAYVTARRWFAAGKLPVPAQKIGGLILVGQEDRPERQAVVVYARVSSADQKADLDRQVAHVTSWATSNGMSVDRVVTEVGSALNGKREKFLSLLADPSVSVIVAEHWGRLARFGVEYIEAALSAQARRLVVAGEAELEDDLVRDMAELLTRFCARLYGRRAAEGKAAAAMSAIRAA